MKIGAFAGPTIVSLIASLLVTAPVLAVPLYPTIAATSPNVQRALSANDVAGAQKMIGKAGAFQGTVTKVFLPDHHNLAILDFATDDKDALTAFIGSNDLGKFGSLAATVQGKRVLISGTFVSYKGRPEIVLTNPAQLKLIH